MVHRIGFDSDDYRLNLAALVRIKRTTCLLNKLQTPTLTLSNFATCSQNGPQSLLLHPDIVLHPDDLFLACRRADHGFWQCPQGGLEEEDSSASEAVLRELVEELGVARENVRLIYEAAHWRRYDFGSKMTRSDKGRKGQQQKWFLCEITSLEDCSLQNSHEEFSELKALSINQFVSLYAAWKATPFLDFCKELGFIPATAQK